MKALPTTSRPKSWKTWLWPAKWASCRSWDLKNEKLRQIDLEKNEKYFLTLFSYQYEWSKVNLCGIDLSLESTASGFDRVGVADVDGGAGSKCTWLPWTLTTNLLFKLFSLQNFKCKYSLFFLFWTMAWASLFYLLISDFENRSWSCVGQNLSWNQSFMICVL